jgi:ABC-2 type transport system permease protein
MVSMATYATIGAALGGAVVIATERESGWTRQLRVTPLPPRAYVAGKLVVSCLVTVPAIAAVLLAGLLVNDVDLPTITWAELLVVLSLGSLPFAALGLLVGYLFDSNSAQGATMITYFSLAILGGLWAPVSSFPDTLATIGRMLPSFRLADLGRTVAGGTVIDPIDVVLLVACAAVVGGLAAWRYRASEQRASG